MSIALLTSAAEGNEVTQGQKGDLESIFYVLLYYVMKYEGPGVRK